MNKILVLFDFDGTLTKNDSFLKFIFFSKGFFIGAVGFFLHVPLILLFFCRRISGGELKQKLVAFYFKGTKKEILNAKGEAFIERLFKSKGFNETVMEKMNAYKAGNAEVCIVSASLNVWIEPFCRKTGIQFICTELEFENGYYNGMFKTPNCNGIEKAVRIKQRYDLDNYSKIVAYGNGNGDKYMFELADEVVLINK